MCCNYFVMPHEATRMYETKVVLRRSLVHVHLGIEVTLISFLSHGGTPLGGSFSSGKTHKMDENLGGSPRT